MSSLWPSNLVRVCVDMNKPHATCPHSQCDQWWNTGIKSLAIFPDWNSLNILMETSCCDVTIHIATPWNFIELYWEHLTSPKNKHTRYRYPYPPTALPHPNSVLRPTLVILKGVLTPECQLASHPQPQLPPFFQLLLSPHLPTLPSLSPGKWAMTRRLDSNAMLALVTVVSLV